MESELIIIENRVSKPPCGLALFKPNAMNGEEESRDLNYVGLRKQGMDTHVNNLALKREISLCWPPSLVVN